MARTSKSDGESKTPKTAAKAAAKAPARRRSDKAKQAATAAASDSAATATMTAETVEVVTTAGNGELRANEVQRRAYELYVQRGCCDGHDKDDWYEAERQLRQQAH